MMRAHDELTAARRQHQRCVEQRPLSQIHASMGAVGTVCQRQGTVLLGVNRDCLEPEPRCCIGRGQPQGIVAHDGSEGIVLLPQGVKGLFDLGARVLPDGHDNILVEVGRRRQVEPEELVQNRDRSDPSHGPLESLSRGLRRGERGDATWRTAPHDGTDGEAVTGLTHLGDYPDRLDGVAAEREEVIVDTDLVKPKDLRHGHARRLLGRGLGTLAGPGDGLEHLGQRPDVSLAVTGQRHLRDLHQVGGNHVSGQEICQHHPHRRDVQRLIGNEVASQGGREVRLPARDDDRVANVGELLERGSHLVGLNPEASDLHLLVPTAQEVECPVGQPPHEVTGAVEASRPVWVRDEPLRRQLRVVEVTEGHSVTAGDELPHLSDAAHTGAVENMTRRVRDGASDRNVPAAPRNWMGGGEGCVLRRAVTIDDQDIRVGRVQHRDMLG